MQYLKKHKANFMIKIFFLSVASFLVIVMVKRHTQWSGTVIHTTDLGNTFSFGTFYFLFDVSNLLILLVQVLSFDQAFVRYNLETSFLEGQELSNSNTYQIKPNKVVTAQDKLEPKLEFQNICANYYFLNPTVLTLQGKKREERSYLLSA